MVICKCGKRFNNVLAWPIRCSCGAQINRESEQVMQDPDPGSYERRRPSRFDRAKQTRDICESNRCGHFGRHECSGEMRQGCELMLVDGKITPCRMMGHQAAGGGCLASVPQYHRTRVADRRPAKINRELVVNRYRETLDWLRYVPSSIDRITVYNRGDYLPEPMPGSRVHVIDLPNVCKEASGWLWHWVTCRDSLAAITFTVQGHPFDHSPDIFRLLDRTYHQPTSLSRHYKHDWPKANVTQHDEVVMIGDIETRLGNAITFGDRPHHTNREWLDQIWPLLFACDRPDPLRYGYGAQYAVPSWSITGRPASWWAWLLTAAMGARSPQAFESLIDAWSLEAMWLAIYRPDLYAERA